MKIGLIALLLIAGCCAPCESPCPDTPDCTGLVALGWTYHCGGWSRGEQIGDEYYVATIRDMTWTGWRLAICHKMEWIKPIRCESWQDAHNAYVRVTGLKEGSQPSSGRD